MRLVTLTLCCLGLALLGCGEPVHSQNHEHDHSDAAASQDLDNSEQGTDPAIDNDNSNTGNTTDPEPDPVPVGLPLNDFLDTVSAEVCDALFRCCGDEDRNEFFGPIAANQKIVDAGLSANLPPNSPMTADSCRATMKAVYLIQPFGAWVEAAKAERVVYLADEAEACVAELQEATCGEELRSALFNSQCFGFAPPMSALEGRRYFQRQAGEGSACSPLTDGVGGAIYGTCNPEEAWCCRPRDDGSCGLDPEAIGRCTPIRLEGESCSMMGTMEICQSGLECDFENRECVAPNDAVLAAGDLCYENFRMLGDCDASYCDMMGSNECVPYRTVGEECMFPYECETGVCDAQVCQENQMCVEPSR